MSRIEIDAGGRRIVIEHDGELEPLRQTALSLWEQTDCPDRPGPAVGFQAERRYTPPAQPSGMRWAPGPYPVQAEHPRGTELPPPDDPS
ncbi:hypothetical protein [Micromonospora aurantiaca (nom. illeg.)]|uniref:hypothetical protein n=1 Tax=Micromonospora aurantiaca (nom. illeg.) TaxID=47850 RepID=UPI003417C4E4